MCKPYYSSPQQQWEDHRDYFVKSNSKQEKRMNTYTLTGREINNVTYRVEAEDEDAAIRAVEWQDADELDREVDAVEDVEVIEVERGDTNYRVELTLTIVARGNISRFNEDIDSSVRDALWNILERQDGTIELCGEDGEVEMVGYNIEHLEEA